MKRGENAEYSWNFKRKIIYQQISQLNWKYILDVGCANGEELRKYVSLKGGNVFGFGVDINEIKSSNTKNIQFVRGDALHLPFKKDTFDLITATEIIEHFDFDTWLILESLDELKEEGMIE